MRIPVITGPTAAGKTAVVLGFAEKYNIEIVSADAYQVYKYMDIGTAKPDKKELSAAPHHMIDIFTPDMTYSAGLFFYQGQKIIAEIIERGNVPVVAGGTGLYVHTLQNGIFDGPDRDEELRREIEEDIEKLGSVHMHGILNNIDPEFAAKVKNTDPTRILRGLEINRQLKMTVEKAQREFHRDPDFKYDIFVLTEDRQKIYDRINRRVDIMFNAGWGAEVEKLLSMGYDDTMDSFKAIGYRNISECIKDSRPVTDAAERIKTLTRNFAKRQLTWFRRMLDIKYVDLSDKNEVKRVEEYIFT
ncbi:MAG: tRNA (adenosine(37)-N6)-dimethylallyltransferase MiaA [Denitrovibrio sp.]|nr:MAG: tRNA (adenosine(37)-N6)-dimethylallyltransferase MiaA [Denitrovibrio sp.]